MKPIVSLQNVSVAFQEVEALCGVNMEVYPGEFLGICGPNGAGKSTLLKTILGLIQPQDGQVLIDGKDILSQQRSEIGYVPQLRSVDPHFPATVKDVVMMGRVPRLGLFKRPGKRDHEIVDKVLHDLELEAIADHPIGKISGGQFQKVLVARALAQEPRILVLDEPTSALDFRMTKSFMELLKKLNRESQLTIISVHHDLQLLKDYATRIICIDRAIEWEGKPTDTDLDKELLRLFFYRSPH